MLLADLGADVVKVERPGTGDDARAWGPPFVGEDAAYFLALNRNKRSVVLNLETEGDRSLARRLALSSDVVVENFRPGLMTRFGLDYEGLSAAKPALVYCSLTAFGERAGEASRPGYDIIMQALSGLMSVTGHPGGEPTKVGVALLDVICGLYAANGIQAALIGRQHTGRGTHVTVSLFDAGVAALVNQAANHLLGGLVPGPMGNAHPNIVPYQLFRTKDRPIVIAAGNDRLFSRTCEILGLPELARDERYSTNESRVLHRDELVEMLSDRLTTRSASQWISELEAGGVPCAIVRTIEEVFSSAEGGATIQDFVDPVRGPLRLVAEPIRLDGVTPPPRMPPPRLGEHTDEVLRELEG